MAPEPVVVRAVEQVVEPVAGQAEEQVAKPVQEQVVGLAEVRAAVLVQGPVAELVKVQVKPLSGLELAEGFLVLEPVPEALVQMVVPVPVVQPEQQLSSSPGIQGPAIFS